MLGGALRNRKGATSIPIYGIITFGFMSKMIFRMVHNKFFAKTFDLAMLEFTCGNKYFSVL